MPSILDMLHIDMPHLFVMFLIFAFVGWSCEEVYVSIGQRKLVKRGMLYGPICPIYGFGGVIIIECLYPWRDTWVRLFFASMVLTSVLEYFVSWLLEKLFHAKWWDYSHNPFNINGRVCLLNSTLFGLLGIAQWHYVEPFVYNMVYWKPLQPWFEYFYVTLALILSADILATIKKLVNFNATMEKFKQFSEQLKERYEGEEWFKPQSMHTMLASIKQKASLDSTKFSTKFLAMVETYGERQRNIESWLNRFPSMSSKDYAGALDHIKQVIAENVAENKRLLNEQKEAIIRRTNTLIAEGKNKKLAAKTARKEFAAKFKKIKK